MRFYTPGVGLGISDLNIEGVTKTLLFSHPFNKNIFLVTR